MCLRHACGQSCPNKGTNFHGVFDNLSKSPGWLQLVIAAGSQWQTTRKLMGTCLAALPCWHLIILPSPSTTERTTFIRPCSLPTTFPTTTSTLRENLRPHTHQTLQTHTQILSLIPIKTHSRSRGLHPQSSIPSRPSETAPLPPTPTITAPLLPKSLSLRSPHSSPTFGSS